MNIFIISFALALIDTYLCKKFIKKNRLEITLLIFLISLFLLYNILTLLVN